MYIKEAIEAAGKPFRELSPEEVGGALRKYEIHRSYRVAHIVGKSGYTGNIFMIMGYLVSSPAPRLKVTQNCVQSLMLYEPIKLPCECFSTLSIWSAKMAATTPHALPTPSAIGPHNFHPSSQRPALGSLLRKQSAACSRGGSCALSCPMPSTLHGSWSTRCGAPLFPKQPGMRICPVWPQGSCLQTSLCA